MFANVWREKVNKYRHLNRKFRRAASDLNLLSNDILSVERVSDDLKELAQKLDHGSTRLQELHDQVARNKKKLWRTVSKEKRDELISTIHRAQSEIHDKTRELKEARDELHEHEAELKKVAPNFREHLRDFDQTAHSK